MRTYFCVVHRPENPYASEATMSWLVYGSNAREAYQQVLKEVTYESAERMYGPLTHKPANGRVVAFSFVEETPE